MCAHLAGVPLVVCGPTDTANSILLRADVVCLADRLQLACVSALDLWLHVDGRSSTRCPDQTCLQQLRLAPTERSLLR